MKIPHLRLAALIGVAAMLTSSVLQAAVKLPAVIGSNMVLQRDQPVPLWGWDEKGTEVTVTIGESKASAKADADGKWMVRLPALKAGGPHTVTITGTDTVKLENVLVGEVWFCSGQSNMEWTVKASLNPQQEIAAGNHPKIRHIKIPHTPAETPQTDVKSDGWKVCSPETVADFTAVGYFFGRSLQEKLDVPIGLIGCNWGGTRIEPWTPPQGFKAVPALKDIADNLDKFPQKNAQGAINHQSALALYNGMVHPLVPYGIKGAIWYQGESNNGEGMLYHEKMKALISGWRSVWGKEDLPFGFVQLASYKYGNSPPTNLAGIWEAQTATLAVPHTGMAVTVDISDVKDIHPKNKQEVGKRLSLWALAKVYGKSDLVYSGPIYKSMKVDGNKIRLAFDHVGGGLAARDGQPLTWFKVAGEDKNFVEAEAKVEGNEVVVSSQSVEKPVAVRFAWDQIAEPNLSNKEGLPASPFRTDKW
jgi:sialate O-acetylesterase